MRSSKEDVESILEDMRIAICDDKCQPFNRKKNLDALAKLGWMWDDAIDEMLTLTYSDYVCGPEKDREFPLDDDWWIFHRNINGLCIYIKFKILYLRDRSVMIMSFHD